MSYIGGVLPDVDDEDKQKIDFGSGVQTWLNSIGKISTNITPEAGEGGLLESESDVIDQGITKLWNDLGQENQTKITNAVNKFNTAWEGAKRIDNKYDPSEYLASATAHGIEGLGAYWQAGHGVRSGILQAIGIDKGAADKIALGKQLTTGRAFPKVPRLRNVPGVSISIQKLPPSLSTGQPQLTSIAKSTAVPVSTVKINKPISINGQISNPRRLTVETSAFARRYPSKEGGQTAVQDYIKQMKIEEAVLAGKPIAQQARETGSYALAYTRPQKSRYLSSERGYTAQSPYYIKEVNKAYNLTPGGTKRPFGTTITDVHHGGGIDSIFRRIEAHPSTDLTKTDTVSPLAKNVTERYGINLANHPTNLMEVLSHKTNLGRAERTAQISKALDGQVHRDTIHALQGTSKVKFSPRPNWEKQVGYESYPVDAPLPKDPFPTYPIKNAKGELIENWTPTTQDQYERRFPIVLSKLGINKKLDLKQIKIDPDLNIYGGDHGRIHDYLTYFERTPGNPLYESEQALKSNKFSKLNLNDAGDMVAKDYLFMEQVSGHILKYRYQKIEELYRELWNDPTKPLAKLGYNTSEFKNLNAESKRRFFKRYVNRIAVKGGAFKGPSKNDVLKPLTGWTPGMTEVWMWEPTKTN